MTRRRVSSLQEAVSVCGATTCAAVINCSGLGSLYLADVRDQSMYPVRGQLCIIRAPWIKHGKTYIGRVWTSYSIPRSNGQVVLGGTREVGDWEASPRDATTEEILSRAVDGDRMLLPENKREDGTWRDLDLMTVGVGRRPARKNGLRLEIDRISKTFVFG